jgi:hypothetical protein
MFKNILKGTGLSPPPHRYVKYWWPPEKETKNDKQRVPFAPLRLADTMIIFWREAGVDCGNEVLRVEINTNVGNSILGKQ